MPDSTFASTGTVRKCQVSGLQRTAYLVPQQNKGNLQHAVLLVFSTYRSARIGVESISRKWLNYDVLTVCTGPATLSWCATQTARDWNRKKTASDSVAREPNSSRECQLASLCLSTWTTLFDQRVKLSKGTSSPPVENSKLGPERRQQVVRDHPYLRRLFPLCMRSFCVFCVSFISFS